MTIAATATDGITETSHAFASPGFCTNVSLRNTNFKPPVDSKTKPCFPNKHMTTPICESELIIPTDIRTDVISNANSLRVGIVTQYSSTRINSFKF